VAQTERHGGSHLPTTWETIAEVAYNTDTFGSTEVTVLPGEGDKTFLAPPITSDPPFHGKARRILLPRFSPRAVEALRPATEATVNSLLDSIEQGETADAATDFAQHVPVRVISHMLGVPASDEAQFLQWAIQIFQPSHDDPGAGRTATKEIFAYFAEVVEERRQHPGEDDLVSDLLRAELDGAPLTPKHVLGSCLLLLMAGIDTTWSSLSASLWHLATHPADRDRLVNEPSLLPTAIEEFLRAYAPVTMARIANHDTEIAGCPVKAGDRVLLPFPAGNRDSSKFDRPNEVIIDRAQNRHFAFGLGIHRCLGSNLARMELEVGIGLWLQRFPQFSLIDGADVQWRGAQVRGPRQVPVRLR